jgi:hypothetical protein
MSAATDWRAELAREVDAMLQYVRAYQRLLDVQFGWTAEAPEAPALERCPPLPALARWRREVTAGTRDRLRFDRLWQAAAREQHAAELWAVAPGIALRYVRDARELMAARRKQAA